MNVTVTLHDLAAVSPFLVVLFGALALLLTESFIPRFSKRSSAYFTMAILIASLAATIYSPFSENPLFTDWIKFDSLSKFFTFFFLSIGAGSVLLSSSFFRRFEASQGEYYFLLLSALFGLMLIGSAADFLLLFLGIETLSIALYVLTGYMKKWKLSHESSIKYFLTGSIAAAFLLYGIALIYGATGTTRFDQLYVSYQALSPSSPEKILFLTGIGLVTVALAFEAAIFPFQLWTPDVYEGSPSPVTAFMAVGTKAGAFAAFIRLFFYTLPEFNPDWNLLVSCLVYPTLIFANFVAIRQTQLRRFFAYSGISHAGFLFIPLAVGTPQALTALLFYLIVYACATLGSFAVLSFVDVESRGVYLHDLKGLFRKSPFYASALSLCLLTLAGIPPTIGFFAKFYLFKVAFDAGYYGLVIIGSLTAVLSAYYYLRIIGVMLSDSSEKGIRYLHAWPSAALGTLALTFILFLSLFPAPLMDFIALTVQ